LQVPFTKRGIRDPLSDVPIPDWPIDGDIDRTREILSVFCDAGLLSATDGGFRPTELGSEILPACPLYNLRNVEDLASRFPELADAVRGRRVLDAGCGLGGHALLLESMQPDRLVALDFSSTQLNTARKICETLDRNMGFVRASVEALPFVENSFDLVF